MNGVVKVEKRYTVVLNGLTEDEYRKLETFTEKGGVCGECSRMAIDDDTVAGILERALHEEEG